MIISRRFSVATCHVVGEVVDVEVDTEKLKVNAPLSSAVDTGSDPDIITAGAETIGRKSNGNFSS